MFSSDTIFALSSGGLPAGVAVMRLSGPDVATSLFRLCGALPSPRQAVLRTIHDIEGDALDRGLVLYFPGPASFTGEDCAELHLHGSVAVVAAVERTLASLPSHRRAEPGEFTRRAFLNGRMDLTAAEGLADLIDAETEMQRRHALVNAEGGQRRLYDGWRADLLSVHARLEADIDFSDQDEIEELGASDDIDRDISVLLNSLERHLSSANQGEIARGGFRVVLLGAPNAGKSTLLNQLAGREAAIVSAQPGTTRDLIEVALDLGGYKVVLTDTAGLREDAGEIESIGIGKALNYARRADLVVWLYDVSCPRPRPPDIETETLVVGTKADLLEVLPEPASLSISALTGKGMDQLVTKLLDRVTKRFENAAAVVPTRRRHVELLQFCRSELDAARQAPLPELKAEHIRGAGEALGRLTGRIDVEDVLGEIFSRFCIGK